MFCFNTGESLLDENFLVGEDDFAFSDGLLDNCFDDVSSISTSVSINKSNTNYYNDDANNNDDDGINNNPSSLLISHIEEFAAENIFSFGNYRNQLYFNADDMNFILDASPQRVLTKFIWTPELVSSHIIT